MRLDCGNALMAHQPSLAVLVTFSIFGFWHLLVSLVSGIISWFLVIFFCSFLLAEKWGSRLCGGSSQPAPSHSEIGDLLTYSDRQKTVFTRSGPSRTCAGAINTCLYFCTSSRKNEIITYAEHPLSCQVDSKAAEPDRQRPTPAPYSHATAAATLPYDLRPLPPLRVGVPYGHARLRRAVVASLLRPKRGIEESPTTPRCARSRWIARFRMDRKQRKDDTNGQHIFLPG